jgi:hypothetical protein
MKVRPVTWVLLGASVLVVIGSLLPWDSLGLLSANGTSGDGQITLIAGLLAVVGVLTFTFKDWHQALFRGATLVFLAAALATSLYEVIHLSGEHVNVLGTTLSPSVGSGLWLCLIASVVGVVASVIEWRGIDDDKVAVI